MRQMCLREGCKYHRDYRDGYCKRHHYRVQKHGDPGPAEFRAHRSNKGKTCPEADCGQPTKIGGFCERHYRNRYMRTYLTKRGKKLWQDFKMTLEEYEALLRKQGGNCALCGQAPNKIKLAVDHCHKSGKIRALLCARCNIGLGYFKDDVALLKRAIAYLKKH